jgi:hypothetical protein
MAAVPTGENLRAATSEQHLRDRYVVQVLTIDQAATRFGLGATTIRRRLQDFGIDARPRGPVAGPRDPRKPLAWSCDLAHVVGLIATDGNLSRKRGRIAIMSNDTDLLDVVRQRLSSMSQARSAFEGPFPRNDVWCLKSCAKTPHR